MLLIFVFIFISMLMLVFWFILIFISVLLFIYCYLYELFTIWYGLFHLFLSLSLYIYVLNRIWLDIHLVWSPPSIIITEDPRALTMCGNGCSMPRQVITTMKIGIETKKTILSSCSSCRVHLVHALSYCLSWTFFLCSCQSPGAMRHQWKDEYKI